MSCLCVLLSFVQEEKGGAFPDTCTEEMGFDLWPSGSALLCAVVLNSPQTVNEFAALALGLKWSVRLLSQGSMDHICVEWYRCQLHHHLCPCTCDDNVLLLTIV